jgi:cell division septum initiation protein DivIVA
VTPTHRTHDRDERDARAAVDEVTRKIDELVALVEGARAMPMSASCVVNRGDVLAMLDELRTLLPAEFRQAEYVIRDRDEVVEEGRREAERIVAAAREERLRLIDETEVVQEALAERERILAEAQARSEAMRQEVDDYVDTKLANFEVVLTRTLGAVERGRDKLRARSAPDPLDGPPDEAPLPEIG